MKMPTDSKNLGLKKMIKPEEILKGQICPPELQANLNTLVERLNMVRDDYDCPMVVSSGYRSKEKQIKIYEEKYRRHEFPFQDGRFDMSRIPMKSAHLYCQAADIYDPNGALKAWLQEDLSRLERYDLYCEDFEHTPTWVHFQINPPKSGRRIFKP